MAYVEELPITREQFDRIVHCDDLVETSFGKGENAEGIFNKVQQTTMGGMTELVITLDDDSIIKKMWTENYKNADIVTPCEIRGYGNLSFMFEQSFEFHDFYLLNLFLKTQPVCILRYFDDETLVLQRLDDPQSPIIEYPKMWDCSIDFMPMHRYTEDICGFKFKEDDGHV